MTTWATRLSSPPDAGGGAPFADHEWVRGWGVFALPFDSGHVLALRVFPQGSFGAFAAVWHRDPEGRWSIHVDAPRPDTACPRYFGPATEHSGSARIRLRWTGPSTLLVTMDEPSLDWILTVSTPRRLRVVNTLGAALPRLTWRWRVLVHARERLAAALGAGPMRLTMRTPSGHQGLLMPRRMAFVDASRAVLAGRDLGRPVRTRENPTIGHVLLPARGVLAEGEVVWRIRDRAEHERTAAASAQPTTGPADR